MTEEYNFLTNFRFMLRVDGAFDVPLKSVRAFSRENEYDYIQEGGMNDYVYMRRKPISKPFTLQVERYVATDFNDPLSNGTELLLPLMLFVGKNTGGSIDFGRYYFFTGAVVMSKEYGGLDAERGGLLTETVTIGYNQMFCVTNPEDATSKPEWKFADDTSFDDNGNPLGNTKRLYSKNYPMDPLQNSDNERTFKQRARKWEFDEKFKDGKGDSSQQHPIKEISQGEMVNKRRYYNFAAENNDKFKGIKKSTRSAQNSLFSDKTLGEGVGIKELTQAELEAKAQRFEFTTAEEYTGNGKLSSRRHPAENQPDEKALAEKSVKWEFKNKDKAGNGKQSSQNNIPNPRGGSPDGSSSGIGKEEQSRSAFEERAVKSEFGKVTKPEKGEFVSKSKLWEFNGLEKAGNGEGSRNTGKIRELPKADFIKSAKGKKADGQNIADFLMG